MTKVAEITVSGLTPMRAATRGFSAGRAHRPAEAGAVDEVHQPRQRQPGGDEDQDLHVVDHRAEHHVRVAGQEDRVRLVVRLPDDHRQRLQQQAHPHRRDERREARRVAQRPVGDLLDREVERRTDDHRRAQRDQEQCPARQAESGERGDDGPARQRTDHQHLAVGEVDQVDDPVDHRVAERDQRIDAAEHEPVDDLLDEGVHARRRLY
jgi:hypothetical protein